MCLSLKAKIHETISSSRIEDYSLLVPRPDLFIDFIY